MQLSLKALPSICYTPNDVWMSHATTQNTLVAYLWTLVGLTVNISLMTFLITLWCQIGSKDLKSCRFLLRPADLYQPHELSFEASRLAARLRPRGVMRRAFGTLPVQIEQQYLVVIV